MTGDRRLDDRRAASGQVIVFATAAEFRAWLEANHDTSSEQWVGYYRKGVPKRSMTYAEAVEEALCFGWIDGVARRVDDEVHANRFTPRTKRSTWSALNVARMQALIAGGRAHPAGLAAFEARTPDRTGIYSYENRPADLPPAYRARLDADAAASAWWRAQTPGYRRVATWWVVSARREDTRERRLATLIEDCAAGRKIGSEPHRTAREPGPG
jgi:uncharacterized protein YdeI (YjbR/CyaY-like superfamily)